MHDSVGIKNVLGKALVEGEYYLGGAHFIFVFSCQTMSEAVHLSKLKNENLAIAGKSVLILDDEISIAEFVALAP